MTNKQKKEIVEYLEECRPSVVLCKSDKEISDKLDELIFAVKPSSSYSAEKGKFTKYTDNNIQILGPKQVIVFGANRAGRHGAGLAKLAHQKFGAVYGKVGLVGQSYGLCTKDQIIRTMPLDEIREEIEKFLKVAVNNPHLEFLMTEVGCGLAGYQVSDIAPLFYPFKLPSNVIFPKSFYEEWEKIGGYREEYFD